MVMPKKNKIFRISLMGGLIGLLTTNPRKALEDNINELNAIGYSVVQVKVHKTTNLFVWALQVLVLLCTFGLFTWGGGYLVIFEKEIA